jgi:hypothetical protein
MALAIEKKDPHFFRLGFCTVQQMFTIQNLLHGIKIEEQTKRNNLREEYHPERM